MATPAAGDTSREEAGEGGRVGGGSRAPPTGRSGFAAAEEFKGLTKVTSPHTESLKCACPLSWVSPYAEPTPAQGGHELPLGGASPVRIGQLL